MKNIVLLLFSLFFYAWGEPVYIILMLVTTLVDYTAGRLMGRLDEKETTPAQEEEKRNRRNRRLILAVAVIIDLSLLAFFKYADMAVRGVNALMQLMNAEHTAFALPGIALPIGISFYTFQSMSYTIDRYRGKVPVQKNYADYLTYVSMFPQLIAGPIVRYADVQKELSAERRVGADAFFAGFRRFLFGLFRKVLIANRMGALWDDIRMAETLSVPSAWLGLLAFTLQIYYDFSAYSDMAIGLGRMMGFYFPENFVYPLAARSMTDFWRRWHISLSGWFRDYVYIPLGGNRRGRAKQVRNLLVVFFLTGLWHGAFLNYILWGLYHGLFLILEKFLLPKVPGTRLKWLCHVYTLVVTTIGFGIFYFEDIAACGVFFGKLFGAGAAQGGIVTGDILWYIGNYLPQLLIACVCAFPLVPWMKTKIAASGKSVQRTVSTLTAAALLMLFVLSVASLVRDTYNPFLYFRF